jgi:hypothetical protein
MLSHYQHIALHRIYPQIDFVDSALHPKRWNTGYCFLPHPSHFPSNPSLSLAASISKYALHYLITSQQKFTFSFLFQGRERGALGLFLLGLVLLGRGKNLSHHEQKLGRRHYKIWQLFRSSATTQARGTSCTGWGVI